MTAALGGVRVVEVAAWTFVPAAGAVLADWGAEVIKVEHPVTGDPQRGLVAAMLSGGAAVSVDYMIEQPNRGKRSIGIDLASEPGRELLYKLVESADVFLTNFLPAARSRLEIDVSHIRARKADIIYVRGSGLGPRGPERERGGYDAASFWARAGVGSAYQPPSLDYPVRQTAAFGDLIGAQTIAGGIAAALFRRERHGEPSVVDVSLLGVGAWVMSLDVVAAGVLGGASAYAGFPPREEAFNPVANVYRTKDGRFLQLVLLQSDRYWSDFCHRIGRADLIDDPRFVDGAARAGNRRECVAILDKVFASADLEEWMTRLADHEGVWSPFQLVTELPDDPQIQANEHLVEVKGANGEQFALVANPVQFDETSPNLTRAPEHGEHTEQILLELGYGWDDIAALKEVAAVL